MLALGAGARPVPVTTVECLRPGLLSAAEVAELLRLRISSSPPWLTVYPRGARA